MYSQFGQPPRYAANAPDFGGATAHGLDAAGDAAAAHAHAGSLATHFQHAQQVHHHQAGTSAAFTAVATASTNQLARGLARTGETVVAVHDMNIGDPNYVYGVPPSAEVAVAAHQFAEDPYGRMGMGRAPPPSAQAVAPPPPLTNVGDPLTFGGSHLAEPQPRRIAGVTANQHTSPPHQQHHHYQQNLLPHHQQHSPQHVHHQHQQQHLPLQGQMEAQDPQQNNQYAHGASPGQVPAQARQCVGGQNHQQVPVKPQPVHAGATQQADNSVAAAQAQQQNQNGTVMIVPAIPLAAKLDVAAAATGAIGVGVEDGAVKGESASVDMEDDEEGIAGVGSGPWVCPRCGKTMKARCGLTSHLNHCDPEKLAQEASRDPQEKALKISVKRREGWEKKYQDLVAFKKLYRHCRVPSNSKNHEFPGLGSWVSAQRREYKKRQAGEKSQITDERVLKLVQVGFEWGLHETNWDASFRDLLEYKRKYGNCDVPIKYKPNPHLSVWVARQRCAYKNRTNGKQSGMTDERVKALEDVGFKWSMGRVLPGTRDMRFEERIGQLKEFKAEFGHCNVPRNFENSGLASWVEYQRYCHRHGESALTDQRRAMLDEVGFDWNAEEEKKQAKQHKRVVVNKEKLQKKEEILKKKLDEEREKEESRRRRLERKEAKLKAIEEKKAARAEMNKKRKEEIRKKASKRKADTSEISCSPVTKKMKDSKPKVPKTKAEVLALLKAKREEKRKDKKATRATPSPKSESKGAVSVSACCEGRYTRSPGNEKTEEKETDKLASRTSTMKLKRPERPKNNASASQISPLTAPQISNQVPLLAPPPGISLLWTPSEALTAITPTSKKKRGRPRKNDASVAPIGDDEKSRLERKKAAAAAAAYFAQMAKAWQEVADSEVVNLDPGEKMVFMTDGADNAVSKEAVKVSAATEDDKKLGSAH